MKQLHLHQSAGIHIHDNTTDETMYIDTLAQAAQDAALEVSWPDPEIVRIFSLEDGRIAVVRETAAGLSQEAASPMVQSLYHTLAAKADRMVQQRRARLEVGKQTTDEIEEG